MERNSYYEVIAGQSSIFSLDLLTSIEISNVDNKFNSYLDLKTQEFGIFKLNQEVVSQNAIID